MAGNTTNVASSGFTPFQGRVVDAAEAAAFDDTDTAAETTAPGTGRTVNIRTGSARVDHQVDTWHGEVHVSW